MRDLLIDTGHRILEKHDPLLSANPAEGAHWDEALWESYEGTGLTHMLGAGDDSPTLGDALALVTQAAGQAAAIPLAETLLACHLLASAGADLPSGPATVILDDRVMLSNAGPGEIRLSGTVGRVPWASICRHAVVAVCTGDGISLALAVLSADAIAPATNLAGEASDDVRLDGLDIVALVPSPLPRSAMSALAALFRAAQLAGALDSVTKLTIEYVSLREQFGRPIRQFQAVKHAVGRLGAERAAASAALALATNPANHDQIELAAAMAKVRTGMAASEGAAIAHQLFGAIGYTREHSLQKLTRRIWAWRDEFGTEKHWSRSIGEACCLAGAEGLWPLLTAADPNAALREDVRAFLRDNACAASDGQETEGVSSDLSRAIGARGWIGSNWPSHYGGHDGDPLDRFALLEEMLAHGAPVFAHMVGERQSGPLLLKFGTEEQRARFLPRITAGECYFCIGMSEPQAGSDLAALRLKAEKVNGGWVVNGSKLWTSLAHVADYIIVLCRTSPAEERHKGMSQLIIDLRSEGISIEPIVNLLGEHEFNQVFFDDVFVPEDNVVGQVGAGWEQALSELTNERGGPDRYLSNFALLRQAVDAAGLKPCEAAASTIGALVSQLTAIRHLAGTVAQSLANGEDPAHDAAMVKHMGANFEQHVAEGLRHLTALRSDARFGASLDKAILRAPSFSIRGGTREILLGVIADGLFKRQ